MVMRHRSLGCWTFILLSPVFLAGCAGTISSQSNERKISIISDPAGAVAYADGAELGTTPLVIEPEKSFRSGFVGFSYRYFGKLMLKKDGCDTWSTEVDDHILSKNVVAKLKCDPDYHPPVAPSASPASVHSVNDSDPYVERLERIEMLHKKGLITDEEYQQLRARLLDKL